MRKRDAIIYRTAVILLAAELIVLGLSILLHPVSDGYLAAFGTAVLITMAAAAYGFIRSRMER